MDERRLRRVARFQRIIRVLFGWLLLRCTVEGWENLPPGGAVLANNHRSYADPPVLWFKMRAPMVFMAARGMFKVPIFGHLLDWMGFIRVYRTKGRTAQTGLAAIQEAVERVKSGLLLGIYPEGGIIKPGQESRLKSGIYHLYKAGCVVVPVVSYDMARIRPMVGITRYVPRLWRRAHIKILPPLPPDLRKDELLARLQQCFASSAG